MISYAMARDGILHSVFLSLGNWGYAECSPKFEFLLTESDKNILWRDRSRLAREHNFQICPECTDIAYLDEMLIEEDICEGYYDGEDDEDDST